MTNKIIFSSEEQKKIDDARARFNVWRESLGCANGSLIVYGTLHWHLEAGRGQGGGG